MVATNTQVQDKEGLTNDKKAVVPHNTLLDMNDEPGVDSTSARLISKPEDCQCGLCVP